jgi:hypothetical protein
MTDADLMRAAGTAADAQPDGAVDAVVAACPFASHWVEIELVGDDGAPVADAAYAIELPDGRVQRGKLDARGLARIAQLGAGTCRVSFPDLDGGAYKPL